MMAYTCLVVALSLLFIQSEACLIFPPPPTPAPTPAPSTAAQSTTAIATTSKPKACPMDGKTCVAEGNVVALKSTDSTEKSNKECEDYEDSKCKFWTYVPTRRLCFLLSSCSEKAEDGIISGDKGCIVPLSKITVFNLFADKAVKEIKIEWENSAVCPTVDIAELAALKSQELTYYEKPDSLKCGKLKKVEGKMDTVACTALENVDPANFYFKTDLADPTKFCPMDGKSCVNWGGNVLNKKLADSPDKCNKECEDYEDSKCKFWTYVPTNGLCFLLSSCSENAEDGIISGDKGCIVQSGKCVIETNPKITN